MILRHLISAAHVSPLLIGFTAGCLASAFSLRPELPVRFMSGAEQSAAVRPGEISDGAIEEDDGQDRNRIVRAHDGFFHAPVVANGLVLSCIVDTGASAMVLNPTDGRRLGLAPAASGFSGRLETAGGSRPAAIRRLIEVIVGGYRLHDVPAVILRTGSSPCLLGQDILARMGPVDLHGDILAFR